MREREGKLASRFHKSVLRVSNISIRLLSVFLRFGLLVYLTKYFTLSEVGEYGLISGVVLIVVPLSDLGFSLYISRELSGVEPKSQLSLILANITALLISTPIAIVLIMTLQSFKILSISISTEFYIIIILEIYCNMFYMALLAVQRPLAANIVVFIRSAFWVMPVAALGLLYPPSRTFRTILLAWMIGCLLALAGSACYFLPLHVHLKTAVKETFPRLKKGFGISLTLWFATASGIAAQYSDRFIIERLLGLEFVGIVTVFWTIANVVQILTSTSITFLFQPKFIIAYNTGDKSEFRSYLYRALLEIMIFAGTLSVILAISFPYLLQGLGRATLLKYVYFFPYVMIASFMRIVSECLYIAIYSIRDDKGLWLPNIVGLILSISMNVMLIPEGGFPAVVWVLNLVTFAILIMRMCFLTSRLRCAWK